MVNLVQLAKQQNGVITLEQLTAALEELKSFVESDRPTYDGRYRSTTIYDGEAYLLRRILESNGL